MNTLRIGDRFPELTVEAVGGGKLRLPDEVKGSYALLVFYRGRW